jgi:hypothetical protein
MNDRRIAAAHLFDQVVQELAARHIALSDNYGFELAGGGELLLMLQNFPAGPAGDEDTLAASRGGMAEDDVERICVRHRSLPTHEPAGGHFSSDVGGRHLPVRLLIS